MSFRQKGDEKVFLIIKHVPIRKQPEDPTLNLEKSQVLRQTTLGSTASSFCHLGIASHHTVGFHKILFRNNILLFYDQNQYYSLHGFRYQNSDPIEAFH